MSVDIRQWLDRRPDRHYGKVEDYVEYVADDPTAVSEPYSRHLGVPVRELRFDLAGEATRVAYRLAPVQPHRHDRRAVMNHSQWKTTRTRALLGEPVQEDPEVTAFRLEIRYARAFGQALYDRRTVLGLSQAEVARRANMTQPQISRIEGGDTVPTLPLLERLAGALEAELDIHVVPGNDAEVRFHSPAA